MIASGMKMLGLYWGIITTPYPLKSDKLPPEIDPNARKEANEGVG
jgi:hypothetical protein